MTNLPEKSKATLRGELFTHSRFLQEDLLARLEVRLATAPHSVELQVERSHLLAELNRMKEAAQVYREATKARTPRYPLTTRAYSVLPFKGTGLPITVVLVVSPQWGNAPFRRHLDDQTFLTLQVIADYHEPGVSLPPHQLVINCISDADSCRASLEAAQVLLKQTTAPVINCPARILLTGREEGAARLASIPGVKTPRVATLPRDFFSAKDVTAALHARGFSFPFLLRSPGHHGGLHFVKVETPRELEEVLPTLPGDSLSLIEFLDARSADGLIRKYRVMIIDGKFYPAHCAISPDWKVHYFSAAMTDFPDHRTEDEAFLKNMRTVLGPRVMAALEGIRDALGLDYFGVDFAINKEGELLLFEANATMNVQPPSAEEIWAYRREPVRQIADAMRAMFFSRPFISGDGTFVSPVETLREFTLHRIESALARSPDATELKIDRGNLLMLMERFEEARDIYLDVLRKEPTQFVALNNLGIVYKKMGFNEAAYRLHEQVAKVRPDDARALVSLAHSLRDAGELIEARERYEEALRLSPDLADAHEGLGHVLMYLGENEAAWAHHKRALKPRPSWPHPSANTKRPRALVILGSCGGNSPIMRLVDKETCETLSIVTEFLDLSEPLPDHDLVINTVGDADYCGISLETAERLLKLTDKPVLNLPSRVRTTGRADNARLLGGLEGVITPRISVLPRETLLGTDAVASLEELGFTFPLLLRSPGFHGGDHFLRVENADGLGAAAAQLPGQNLMAIQYLDARDDDGKIRKYRVMMIGGKLYPLHKAISQAWMIHYFSADMTHSDAHRAEDQAFLEDMPAILGKKAIAALERIRDALGLDYAGADFSLNRNGEVLLFETNATMAVPFADKGERWNYRREPVRRIQAAVREMIVSGAKPAKI